MSGDRPFYHHHHPARQGWGGANREDKRRWDGGPRPRESAPPPAPPPPPSTASSAVHKLLPPLPPMSNFRDFELQQKQQQAGSAGGVLEDAKTADQLYGEYTLQYVQEVSDRFFENHKLEEWFLDRYDPLRLHEAEGRAQVWAREESRALAQELAASPLRAVHACCLEPEGSPILTARAARLARLEPSPPLSSPVGRNLADGGGGKEVADAVNHDTLNDSAAQLPLEPQYISPSPRPSILGEEIILACFGKLFCLLKFICRCVYLQSQAGTFRDMWSALYISAVCQPLVLVRTSYVPSRTCSKPPRCNRPL
jgi:hypothetical protein